MPCSGSGTTAVNPNLKIRPHKNPLDAIIERALVEATPPIDTRL
jgi:hypothetical protein